MSKTLQGHRTKLDKTKQTNGQKRWQSVVAGRQQLYRAVQSRSPSHCRTTTEKVQSSACDGTSSATVHSWQMMAGCSTHVSNHMQMYGDTETHKHEKLTQCYLPHMYQECGQLGAQTEVQSTNWPSYCRQYLLSHHYQRHWNVHPHRWNHQYSLYIKNTHKRHKTYTFNTFIYWVHDTHAQNSAMHFRVSFNEKFTHLLILNVLTSSAFFFTV